MRRKATLTLEQYRLLEIRINNTWIESRETREEFRVRIPSCQHVHSWKKRFIIDGRERSEREMEKKNGRENENNMAGVWENMLGTNL